MDFRGQRPVRQTGQQQEPVPPRADEPRASFNTPVTRRESSLPPLPEPSPLRRWLWPLMATGIVILGVAGWLIWSGLQNNNLAIDTSKYQAVFFSNGQVYFGKLQRQNDEYMKLTDVYYLQPDSNKETADDATKQTTSASNVQLIKRGKEVHGPEDTMLIAKDQIQFFENLKNDSQVVQLIAKYKKSG